MTNGWINNGDLLNLDGQNSNVTIHWKKFVGKKIFTKEENEWLSRMQDKDKLRLYKSYKTKLQLEKYLLNSDNSYGRSLHTSMRNGTNQLEIEKGRWSKIPKEQRLCTHCDSKEIEDRVA